MIHFGSFDFHETYVCMYIIPRKTGTGTESVPVVKILNNSYSVPFPCRSIFYYVFCSVYAPVIQNKPVFRFVPYQFSVLYRTSFTRSVAVLVPGGLISSHPHQKIGKYIKKNKKTTNPAENLFFNFFGPKKPQILLEKKCQKDRKLRRETRFVSYYGSILGTGKMDK